MLSLGIEILHMNSIDFKEKQIYDVYYGRCEMVMELRVLENDMVVAELPKLGHWRIVQQYGSTKYKLQP